MLCPYCLHKESKVTNKRDFGEITRRRRECLKCRRRFNTLEEAEMLDLKIIKKNGVHQDFDRKKLMGSILKACKKRPISTEKIDKMIITIENKLRKKGKEIKSSVVGEFVSGELRKVDKVAYIRFASVYKDFTDIDHFKNEIQRLVKK